MMDLKAMPFLVWYNQHNKKTTIKILLGSFLILLLYQTPSKIKYIQNDLKEILVDDDVIQQQGKEKHQNSLNRRINLYNFKCLLVNTISLLFF